MLNNTLQDVLIRRARLKGFNAGWVPGTDHASIATEAKVVAKLKSEGVEKSDLTREEFLEHAWAWTHKHGGIILEQLKKLGASCDWQRTKFTMDPDLSESVIQVFIDLYRKAQGIQTAKVTVAAPLTEALEKEIVAKAKAMTGSSTIELVTEIDPSIIGGFVLRVGDLQYNASIANQFQKIKREFRKSI